MIKNRIKEFLKRNVVQPVTDITNEAIYQGVFHNQCRNLGIANDFYPLAGAASHGMLYMLARLLTDERLVDIVEFGSGQSTVLIDRVRPTAGSHLCFEADADWYARVNRRLTRCEYVLAPLEEKTVQSISARTYRTSELRDFDLMLVDGPPGTERYSRFGCADWVAANSRDSFVLILDDTNRPGEQDTERWIADHLGRTGRRFKQQQIRGRTVQTVFAVGALQHVALYV